MEPAPPAVRVPDGWERTVANVETMFDAAVVTVRAHTVVFDDARLRAAIRERTGADGTWRFFFASRLRIRPRTGLSKALTRLVVDRANDGFVEQLGDRGFLGVEAVESRRFAVDRTEADLTRYRARVEMTARGEPGEADGGPVADAGSVDDGATTDDGTASTIRVTAEGYLAVWPADGEFLMAGGAYPLGVDGGSTAADLEPFLDPEGHREELFELIRSTG